MAKLFADRNLDYIVYNSTHNSLQAFISLRHNCWKIVKYPQNGGDNYCRRFCHPFQIAYRTAVAELWAAIEHRSIEARLPSQICSVAPDNLHVKRQRLFM